MDVTERTVVGYVLLAGVLVYYFWAMQRQLNRMRRGYRQGTRYGNLRGYGAILYNLLQSGVIAGASFFAVHATYVFAQSYRLINMGYGIVGILISLATLPIGRLILLPIRFGPSHCSRLLAVGWVSLLSGLLALGVWIIFTTNGKILEMQIPKKAVNAALTALIPLVTAISWGAISSSQSE